MIYISYELDGGQVGTGQMHGRLTVEGHAGYAPEGQDIVCASVSTLVQSFLFYLRAMRMPCERREYEGRTVAEFWSAPRQRADIELWSACQYLIIGLKAIAHDYPDHVRIV